MKSGEKKALEKIKGNLQREYEKMKETQLIFGVSEEN